MCVSTVMLDDMNSTTCIINKFNNNSDTFSVTSNCSVTDAVSWIEPEMDAHNNAHTVAYDTISKLIIDVSKYNFPNEIWEMIPVWEVSVKVATFIPVILLGIIGNLLLLYIILKHRALHTPTNLLIANMAAADLATILVCPIMFMFHDFFQNYKLGAVGCKTEGFLEGALLVTAVLNLCAVSYDRLTAIVLPQETRLTLKGAKIIMISTWIVGFLLAMPLFIYRTYKERQWKNFLESYCSEDIKILPMYWHVLIAALVWFPLSVMVICYSAIFWKLDRYEQKVLKRETPISVSYKTKVAKMLFIVLIIFVILRLPFTALIFIRNQMLKDSVMNQVAGSFHVLWYASHYLIFFNAAINPIIYGLTNDNFRKAYRQTSLVRIMCKSRPSDKTNKDEPKFFNSAAFWNPFGGAGNNCKQKKLENKTTNTSDSTKSSQVKILTTKVEELDSKNDSGFIISNMIWNHEHDLKNDKEDDRINCHGFI